MMIAELIDDDDFRARLVNLGVAIPADADPEECARRTLHQHIQGEVPGLQRLVEELMSKSDILLPEVRQVIERFLLPALR
ncbi:hypothetical protein [Halomonas sp. PR-M31]|uniref:hypothetical protein n=1 Tax=Halomonas sp. PR-M31 TaxID=1471202 RepID=UPI000651F0A4|nr:hypothetical protein [Halomonas sp. PR-M31]